MKKHRILFSLAALSVGCVLTTAHPTVGHAIYLNTDLEKTLLDEGKTSYVKNIFQKKLTDFLINTDGKKGKVENFKFSVPTWSKATSERGGWISRVAGKGPTIISPDGMGVPDYTEMYYGNSKEHQGNFEITDLKASVPDNLVNDVQTDISLVKNNDYTIDVSVNIKFNKDIDVKEFPLKFNSKNIQMSTNAVDPSNKPNNPVQFVKNISLTGDNNSRLELGDVKVSINSTTPSTTETTSSSTSSSTTETTSSSTSSSTTETTSSSTSSSTTETTSSSTSSSTAETTSSSTSSSTAETTSSSTSSSTAETMSTSSERNKTTQSTTKRKSSGIPSVTTTSSSNSSYGTLPKTGEKSQSIWVGLSGIVVIIGTVFFLVLRHKKEKSAE